MINPLQYAIGALLSAVNAHIVYKWNCFLLTRNSLGITRPSPSNALRVHRSTTAIITSGYLHEMQRFRRRLVRELDRFKHHHSMSEYTIVYQPKEHRELSRLRGILINHRRGYPVASVYFGRLFPLMDQQLQMLVHVKKNVPTVTEVDAVLLCASDEPPGYSVTLIEYKHVSRKFQLMSRNQIDDGLREKQRRIVNLLKNFDENIGSGPNIDREILVDVSKTSDDHWQSFLDGMKSRIERAKFSSSAFQKVSEYVSRLPCFHTIHLGTSRSVLRGTVKGLLIPVPSTTTTTPITDNFNALSFWYPWFSYLKPRDNNPTNNNNSNNNSSSNGKEPDIWDLLDPRFRLPFPIQPTTTTDTTTSSYTTTPTETDYNEMMKDVNELMRISGLQTANRRWIYVRIPQYTDAIKYHTDPSTNTTDSISDSTLIINGIQIRTYSPTESRLPQILIQYLRRLLAEGILIQLEAMIYNQTAMKSQMVNAPVLLPVDTVMHVRRPYKAEIGLNVNKDGDDGVMVGDAEMLQRRSREILVPITMISGCDM